MFLATALLYPCVLAVLCAGAGLAVDRCSGGWLPAPLLLSVGAAALVALSQLSAYVYLIAPATPYLMAALALAGFALAWGRARSLARRCLQRPWLVAVPVLAYAIALAPVLVAGRASFSSYMTLADSAVHMLGADFLIRHGMHYAHLDLRNSYGEFINDYYNTSYPSGADTLFGGSASLLRLPLIWAFQPFNAFMLATAAGPAWLLARRIGLGGAWAALAALTVILPALVYAYELFGSVKEITTLPMMLTLGALVAAHRHWLGRAPARAVPFALALAAGVSALGLAFGAWALAAVAVLAVVLAGDLRARRQRARGALALVGVAAAVLLIAAWPTWAELSGALRVAGAIASTTNSGNLHTPLRLIQVLGIWLNGSYKLAPAGASLLATHVLVAIALVTVVLGAVHLLRLRAYALAAWLALMLLASLVVGESVTTWADAKTLVLSSPLVALLAWAGVAALLAAPRPRAWRPVAALLSLALAGGVLASDALQYHSSDLAPSARYEELASLDSRFAGRGPTLFTDFDEYSMYELRDLDVGGPDFVYPPPAVASAAGGYGDPVDLNRVAPSALLAYPLIVTRRDPSATRPPAAYRLLWQGSYYQVWGRRAGAPAAAVHVGLSGSPALQCERIGSLARQAGAGEQLVAAPAPELVRISLARSSHPARWGHERKGLVMSTPGRLSASFTLPASGAWDVWVQGQIMPTVGLSVDGVRIASIAGQLDGNSLVPDTVPPIRVRLAAGAHSVWVTRPGVTLAPGDGGAAVLDAIFLTPAGAAPQGTLRVAAPSRWQSLCGRSYQWVELVRSG
ncbi:MAG: hypothetical protein ABSG93_12895 [Solirubrobacteraceae bacterium]|jgi:hypothetical protein